MPHESIDHPKARTMTHPWPPFAAMHIRGEPGGCGLQPGDCLSGEGGAAQMTGRRGWQLEEWESLSLHSLEDLQQGPNQDSGKVKGGVLGRRNRGPTTLPGLLSTPGLQKTACPPIPPYV